MARTPSNMLPLGTPAPTFSLPDTISSSTLSYEQLAGNQGTLVMFICNHCPFVIHIIDKLTQVCNAAQKQGIGVIAISSNDIENYPADSPEKMTEFAKQNGFEFAYLYDESQDIAKAYDAACTPDFYLFDENNSCVYRGQFDDSRPANDIAVTGNDLNQAIQNLIAGKPISAEQQASLGCNIKWKS